MTYRRPPVGDLTARNLDVLRLAADGHTYAQIARQLYLDHGTVRYHIIQVLGRLGARNTAHAVAIAYRTGVLGGPRGTTVSDMGEPAVGDEDDDFDDWPTYKPIRTVDTGGLT